MSDRNSTRQIMKTLTLVTQLGLTMITAVGLCVAAGIWIDRHFGTQLTIWFLILGVLGGGRGAYSLAVRSVTLSKEEEEDRDVSLRK